MTTTKKPVQVFDGADLFRLRIATSLLSSIPIRIESIRSDSSAPGITDSEASFLNLISALTNGTIVKINETGTTVSFRPGVIVGGGPHVHDCVGGKSIGWFLEGIACLLPFAKLTTKLVLRGITNDQHDQTVDAIRTVTLPLLRHFGITEGVELKVVKRGAPPNGGGEVSLTCPNARVLTPISLIDPGRIKRIRGIAYSARVSPQLANRTVESARSLLNNFIPDVYIYTDHFKGAESGLSPGYGICLVAESTTGVNLAAEVMADADMSPEDIGVEASKLLCHQISVGGCVDASSQALVLVLMCLTPEDVSRVRFGKLTQYSIGVLRLLKAMFGVTFKIKPDGDSVMLTCLGIGFSNFAKASF